jgi:hypothetical protein
MIFTPEHTEKVLAGAKTQTRRLQQPGDEAVRDKDGRIVAVTRIGKRGRRLLYHVDFGYAACPGRGKRGMGRFTITAIRDQCVQDITEEDARAEGVEPAADHRGYPSGRAAWVRTYRAGFARTWNAINGRSGGHRFEANPKVWALTFEADGAR